MGESIPHGPRSMEPHLATIALGSCETAAAGCVGMSGAMAAVGDARPLIRKSFFVHQCRWEAGLTDDFS